MFHQIFHWVLHELPPIVTGFAQSHPGWVLPLAFGVALSESIVGLSVLIPGTVLLIALGGVIGASHMPLLPAYIGAVAGSLVGDYISYQFGLRYRNQILHIWPFSKFEPEIAKGLKLFHDFGVWAIVLGRFLGPIRGVVPLISGISQMAFWPFTIANTAAVLIWAFILLAPGAAVLHHLMP